MRTIMFCAVVIAVSTFAMAVENVYGWAKVTPLAREAWASAYEWSAGLVGVEARAENGGAAAEGGVPDAAAAAD